jgi:PTS system nitrogen regulatory IIA component
MPHEFLTLAELAERLGRDRREIEKLVQRGRIPGHKVEGDWRFHPAEVTHWLEQEMRGYSDDELLNVENTQGVTEGDVDLPVSSLLKPETVQVPLEARTRRSVVESLIELAGRTWQVWEPAALLQAVLEREDVFSTAFENGVAIPHPRNAMPNALGESVVAYGRTANGIPFGGPRRTLTDMFFLVLCRDSRTHLRVLARLGRLLQQPDFVDTLRAAEDCAASYQIICDADRRIAGV